MPSPTRHIFDANTLRNFALVGALDHLPALVDGDLCIGRVVREELKQGARVFPQRNFHRLDDPNWATYVTRFQGLDAKLNQLRFTTLEVTSASTREGEFAFLTCLHNEEVMEDGEAESFTLAAYRDLVLYSDEYKVYREGDNFSAHDFPCPYHGNELPEYDITVHSTAWLLLKGVERGVFAEDTAEDYYLAMRDIWPRHPKKTLVELADGDGKYW